MAGARAYSAIEGLSVAAGEAVDLAITGRFFAVISANINFKIGFDDDALQFCTQGLTPFMEPGEVFTRVRIDNTAGASTLTLTYAYGSGDVRDSRATLAGNIDLSKAATLTSTADVSIAAATTVQVLAANTARREAIITNLAANAETMRVGDSNAGAARGVELPPGATIVLTTTAAIHAYNPGAGAESLAVLEVVD